MSFTDDAIRDWYHDMQAQCSPCGCGSPESPRMDAHDVDEWRVVCFDCGAESPLADADAAVVLWNMGRRREEHADGT